MAANKSKIEYEFIEAEKYWHLKSLYIDLATAKKKALTPVEKTLLRGLLCGYSPAEIANILYQSRSSNTVRVYLSNGLYKYIEEILSQTGSSVKILNWSRVTQLLEKAGYKKSLVEQAQEVTVITREAWQSREQHPPQPSCSWSDSIDIAGFQGRTKELKALEQWIVKERCRLVTLLGMGGSGKTALSVKLTAQIQDQFDYVIWQSLGHAPALTSILAQILQIFSRQTEPIDVSISRLLAYLRSSRCLIVLDHVDALLSSNGHYREGYEDYKELIRQVGNSRHESCLVLTSREKPPEISVMPGKALLVRTFRLTGLTDEASIAILKAQGLAATSQQEWRSLVKQYTGNPLLLKLAGTAIQDLCGGNITQFLKQGIFIFGEIREILDQQFNRLSHLEKQIMYWMVLNQEPLALPKLQREISSSASQQEILEAIELLKRHSMIIGDFPEFLQELVVVEYLVERLMQQKSKSDEEAMALRLGNSLIEAQMKNYIRERRLRVEAES